MDRQGNLSGNEEAGGPLCEMCEGLHSESCLVVQNSHRRKGSHWFKTPLSPSSLCAVMQDFIHDY